MLRAFWRAMTLMRWPEHQVLLYTWGRWHHIRISCTYRCFKTRDSQPFACHNLSLPRHAWMACASGIVCCDSKHFGNVNCILMTRGSPNLYVLFFALADCCLCTSCNFLFIQEVQLELLLWHYVNCPGDIKFWMWSVLIAFFFDICFEGVALARQNSGSMSRSELSHWPSDWRVLSLLPSRRFPNRECHLLVCIWTQTILWLKPAWLDNHIDLRKLQT